MNDEHKTCPHCGGDITDCAEDDPIPTLVLSDEQFDKLDIDSIGEGGLVFLGPAIKSAGADRIDIVRRSDYDDQ